MILHELFRVVSRLPRYISCYIAGNQFHLGQCLEGTVRYDLHRSSSPANFMYFALHPICNPLTKKNKSGMFKRFISLRFLATDITGWFKSQNNRVGGTVSSLLYNMICLSFRLVQICPAFQKSGNNFSLEPRQYVGQLCTVFSTLSETSCESSLFNKKQVAGETFIPQEQ